MKKKLQLARLTIAHLTSTDLQHAVGGVADETIGAGQQSKQIGTKWEPCQWNGGDGGGTGGVIGTTTP